VIEASKLNFFHFEVCLLSSLIILIIIKGWYRERLYARLVIFIYTLLFRLPRLLIILMIKNYWIRIIINFNINSYINFWIILIFIVKLPIWGLHYWLPLAHVEAPTSGRIILAGILLKLGGYGLIRFNIYISNYLLTFFIYGLLIRRIICYLQLDIKRIIAYSRVSHIILIPFIIINNNFIRFKIINIIIFCHGFSRIILFYWIGLIYKIINTRNLLILKGLFYNYPQIIIIYIFIIIININIPPFMGYFREIFRFIIILNF